MKIFRVELRVWWGAKKHRSYEGDRVYLNVVAPGLPTAVRKAESHQRRQRNIDIDKARTIWRVTHVVVTQAEFILAVDVP